MSVEQEIELLKARVLVLEAKVAAGGGGSKGTSVGRVAGPADLDGQYGDPAIKSDPKRWLEKGGDSFAGCHMSECPPEYLDEIASLYDWMADKDDEQGKMWTNKNKPGSQPRPASTFKRKDAALARGWAERKRASAARFGVSGAGNSAKHALPPHDSDGVVGGDSEDTFADAQDDSIPFNVSRDVTPRHLRRRRLWEKF